MQGETKRVEERHTPQMYAPDAIFFSKHQITAQQIEKDVHAIEAHSLCGAHSFLICSCSSCSRSLQYRYVFFVQVPGSATGSDKCWTFVDLWGARVAGARCNCSTCEHVLHSLAPRAPAPLLTDLGNLSTPHTYEPPLAPAARSSHHCVCQCRCHASHTKLAHRHSRRAIADGSREPEYAPPTNRPLHLPRAPLTPLRQCVACAKACTILQVTDPRL